MTSESSISGWRSFLRILSAINNEVSGFGQRLLSLKLKNNKIFWVSLCVTVEGLDG